MPWKRGEQIPTNLIVGFLGSGKTTAITKLVDQRRAGEHWSILINEFGTVSIDHALVDGNMDGVAVEELGGGCVCCTMSFAFKPLLAQFIRRSKPDRLILEPSGLSHPAKVVDVLRSDDFASAIDLRNIICLVDPKDFQDPRWQESEVFQDQVQLADIVVLNWTDERDRDLIDRCRAWVESFNPPKQLIIETEYGVIAPELLDQQFDTVRFPLFEQAHPIPKQVGLPVLNQVENEHGDQGEQKDDSPTAEHQPVESKRKPAPGQPTRFPNSGTGFEACGWVFHVDDIFDRDKLIDLLGMVRPVARLKGVFRCKRDWWQINRAKDATDFSTSTYRRDSRLEIILSDNALDWEEFQSQLLGCLIS